MTKTRADSQRGRRAQAVLSAVYRRRAPTAVLRAPDKENNARRGNGASRWSASRRSGCPAPRCGGVSGRRGVSARKRTR
eukprot:568935-Alexandrium_andersonii.AAC.1